MDNVVAIYAKETGNGMAFDVTKAPEEEAPEPSSEPPKPTGGRPKLTRVK